MNHRIFNFYSVLTFNGENFDLVKDSVKNSRMYTHYINSAKDMGISNKAYEKYLDIKQYIYTKQYNYCKESNFKFTMTNIPDSELKNISEIEKQVSVDDYYNVENEVSEYGEGKVIINSIELIEETIISRTKDLDEYIQKFELEHYREKFITEGKQRYFILPFVGKIGAQIIEPIVILNIYDVGVITLNIMVGNDFENMTLLENNDTFIRFDEVKLYKIKSKYGKKDYFDTEIIKNVGIKEIEEYYVNLLKNVTGIDLGIEEDYAQTANIIGSFNDDSTEDSLVNFIQMNQDKLSQYTSNYHRDIIKNMKKEKIEKTLIDNIVFDRLNMRFIVDETFSLLIMTDYLYNDNIKKAFIDDEEFLKKENLYDDEIFKVKKEMLYTRSFEFFCCYEISLIRKYYSRQLFNNLVKANSINHSNLVENKKLLDLVKLKFDEDVIFRFGGSPKELYISINENIGSNLYIHKSENALLSLYGDISELESIKGEKFNDTILVFTTALSVLLGFSGIKEIVYSVLVNIPYTEFNIVRIHPLRTTVILWGIFISLLIVIIRDQKK